MVDYSSRFQVGLDGKYTHKRVQDLKNFLSERENDKERNGSTSVLSNVKTRRRIIRCRSAFEAGIAKWKGVKSLKFMTLTIDKERAMFSKTFVCGGFRGCWTAFIKRLRRVFGAIEYMGVKVFNATDDENFIHKHIVINAGWIGQRWLSDTWEEITNCPVLDIRTLWYRRGLRNYLGNYIQNQGRLGYSVNWVFPGWRFLSSKIFANWKQKYVPYFKASPYCKNIFYRYVWYRRVLPWFTKKFNMELAPLLYECKYPVYQGNWVPRVL